MTCPKWSLFVAGFCTFLYTCVVLYVFSGLVGLRDIHENAERTKGSEVADVDPDITSSEEEVEVNFSRNQIAIFVIEFVADIIMLIACVFLVVGIKKNNHKFMAPWIYLSITDIVCDLELLYLVDESKIRNMLSFFTMVFIAATWFPILSVYIKLRRAKTQPKPNPAAIERSYETPAYFQHVQQTATAPVQV